MQPRHGSIRVHSVRVERGKKVKEEPGEGNRSSPLSLAAARSSRLFLLILPPLLRLRSAKRANRLAGGRAGELASERANDRPTGQTTVRRSASRPSFEQASR